MAFELPKLQYEYSALEPYIDEQTMRIHHTKHHQAYIDKLNGAVKGTDWENKKIEEIVKNLDNVPENIRGVVRNHGGGHYNHALFWEMMAPKSGGEPKGKIGDEIRNTFGSFADFKEKFKNAGIGQFGSGWAWVVVNNGKLEITSSPNQDNPLTQGKVPVLGVDVWEHSYYVKHLWNRAAYLKDWWNVINWKQVEENYNRAVK